LEYQSVRCRRQSELISLLAQLDRCNSIQVLYIIKANIVFCYIDKCTFYPDTCRAVLATKSIHSVADTSRIDIPTKAMFFRAPFLCNVTLSVPTSSQTTNSFLVNSIIDQLSSNLQNSDSSTGAIQSRYCILLKQTLFSVTLTNVHSIQKHDIVTRYVANV
jgi:hypothetical protein